MSRTSVVRPSRHSGMDGSLEPVGLPDPRQQALELVDLGPADAPGRRYSRTGSRLHTLAASRARSELTAPAPFRHSPRGIVSVGYTLARRRHETPNRVSLDLFGGLRHGPRRGV